MGEKLELKRYIEESLSTYNKLLTDLLRVETSKKEDVQLLSNMVETLTNIKDICLRRNRF